NIARFLTQSTISSLLLTLGFLGLVFEVTTPGWGVPGTAGLVCLLLFFGGRYAAGIMGWEAILLFFVGLLLLILELFVIPGFGIAGILGILGVMGSIILAFGDLQLALINLSVVLVATIAVVVLLWKRITQSR